MADSTNGENTRSSGDPSAGSGGRGRGPQGEGRRDGQGERARNDRGGERSRGSGRGRGRGRGKGRGDSGRSQSSGVAGQESTNLPPPPQPGGAGVLGSRLTKDAVNTQGESGAEDDVEAEVCFICASPISHQSVAPCNHRTCHICSLRLRALYKTKACAHCRTEADTVIFTDEGEKRFEDYTPSDFYRTDNSLGISYERREIFEDTVLLLRFNCPDENCDVACMGWPDLHRHVRSVHNKVMCDLCTRTKKVFTHEHELYTHQELKKHEKFGDDNPGAIDQSGFKGHPECGFCRQRFYGEDELYVHCREKHERCHLCDRRNGGNNPQYYADYNALEKHFTNDHHPCMDSECQEKKFVVFDSQMDLKAHQLEQHPNGLSKDARKDARRVDLSAFDYRSQYEEPRRGGRGGRRGGIGRDPNAEPMPAPSAGHMSRAEIAHQRAREIQSAQSVSSRTFGGSLTQTEPQTQPVARSAHTPRPAASPQPQLPALNGGHPPSAPTSETLTPQEQARRLRHATVTERASALLRNDQSKMNEFRERITSYRTGAVSAPELINAFFSLFDTSSAELGKLIKELAEIFEIPGKRDNLLKAWGDWKAINEDYPSLSGPTGTSAASATGIGGSRVLKLKSSTAQSSRSVSGRAASPWTGSTAPSMSSNPFPSLPPRKGGPQMGSAGSASNPSWLAIRPAASSASSSTRASPAPSRTQSSVNLPRSGGDMFPALPAAAKPTSTVFSPGYRGAGVIRQNNVSSVNAWGGGSEPMTSATEESEQNMGRKGKKGKKVVLQWG